MKKQLVVALILVVAASVGFYFIKKRTPISENEFYKRNPHLIRRAQTPKPPEERTDPRFNKGDYRLEPGKRLVIDFNSMQELSVKSKSVFKLDGGGSLELHSLGWTGQRITLLATLSYSRLALSPDKGANAELKKLLGSVASTDLGKIAGRSVLFLIDPNGRVKKVFGTDNTSITTASEIFHKVRALLRPVPSLTPGVLKATEWDELDQPFYVNYNITEQGSEFSFKGDVLDPGVANAKDVSLKRTLNGKLDWNWAKNTSLPIEQRFDNSESVQFNTETVIQSMSKQVLKFGEITDGIYAMDTVVKLFNREIPFVDLFKSQENIQSENRKKGSSFLTWDQILSKHQMVDSDQTSEVERETVLVELSSALAKDGNLIPRVRDIALSAPAGSRQLTIALGALGFAGTPAAQAALIDAYKRTDLDQDTRTKVLAELAINENPLTSETKSFLMEVHSKSKDASLASSAHFTIGASLWRDGDPSVTKYLQEQHKEASGSDDTNSLRQSLGALGNTRSVTFLEEIQESTGHEDPAVRAEAAMALRFIPTPEAESSLASLLKDESPDVRTSAAQAHMQRPFDDRVRETLFGCTRDSDSGVKTECYRLLAGHASNPEVRQFLEAAAGSESDSEAQRFLKNWQDGQK